MTETTWDKIKRALEPYNLKQVGRDEWRSNIPWRTGSDSMGLTTHVVPGGEYGMWKSHVEDLSGSLYELADRLNIERPKVAPVTPTKRGYTGLADYAEAHGAPVEAFNAAKWVATTCNNRPALQFMVDDQPRYRFMDGDKPHFWWQKGSHPAWYGLARACDIARKMKRDLVYVNGAASVVVAQWFNIPACTVEGGEQALRDTMLDELLAAWDGAIIFALDSDYTGQKAAVASIEAIMKRGRKARNADLVLDSSGDLCDFRKLYGDGAYAELDRRAIVPDVSWEPLPSVGQVEADVRALETEAKAATTDPVEALGKKAHQLAGQVERIQTMVAPVRVLDFHELADELLETKPLRRWPTLPIPELAAVTGPLQPELYVLYGATGMGKSWFAATVAGGLITGWAGTGLIVSTEMSPGNFARRVASWISRVPLTLITDGLAAPSELDAWKKVVTRFKSQNARTVNMSTPTPKQLVQAAKAARAEIGLDWILVDSASRLRGVGDSVYERMTSVANCLQDMAADFSVPVIVTSQVARDMLHRPVGKRAPTLNDAYGSGVIEQNAGVVWGLYRHDYYVNAGHEPANDVLYPPNTARFILLKHRSRGVPEPNYVTARYVAGCGYYPAHRTEKTVAVSTSQLAAPLAEGRAS